MEKKQMKILEKDRNKENDLEGEKEVNSLENDKRKKSFLKLGALFLLGTLLFGCFYSLGHGRQRSAEGETKGIFSHIWQKEEKGPEDEKTSDASLPEEIGKQDEEEIIILEDPIEPDKDRKELDELNRIGDIAEKIEPPTEIETDWKANGEGAEALIEDGYDEAYQKQLEEEEKSENLKNSANQESELEKQQNNIDTPIPPAETVMQPLSEEEVRNRLKELGINYDEIQVY